MVQPAVVRHDGDYLGELAAAGDPGPLARTLPFIADFLDARGQ
ncbi:hypothetical protein ACFQS1_27030 [Paractinoplanes rhizophilus]|uniref:Uncharacterized protein n=1 Tax=Paractinoplanes rhizophilus TaxID=1416877 RepID=A0ABW2HWV5_9ACTN|nr:hypothetical protein [Actinoplanes sp.]